MFARECDADDVLAALDVPALVIHGTADEVMALSAGEHAAALLPDVVASWWSGGGHTPFLTDPGRFVAEVLALTGRSSAGRAGNGGGAGASWRE